MVIQVTTSDFRREVLESERPAVVDFYADWCLPCRQLGPEIKALSEKWERRVGLAKLDVDRAGELAQRYEVLSIPTVLLFEEDKVKARATEVGVPDRARNRARRLEESVTTPDWNARADARSDRAGSRWSPGPQDSRPFEWL